MCNAQIFYKNIGKLPCSEGQSVLLNKCIIRLHKFDIVFLLQLFGSREGLLIYTLIGSIFARFNFARSKIREIFWI